MFEISYEEKVKIEHEAVHKILSGLLDGEKIESLWLEFDAHETKEAIFAYECDKLECDLQSKLYDEEGCVDLAGQDDNKAFKNELVQKLLNEGNSFGEMWLKFGQTIYPYNDNFRAVSNYALTHKIKDRFKN